MRDADATPVPAVIPAEALPVAYQRTVTTPAQAQSDNHLVGHRGFISWQACAMEAS